MTVPPRWMLSLAGLKPERERALARATSLRDETELRRVLDENAERFRREMERRAREPHLVFGTTDAGVPYRVTRRSRAGMHLWGTAASGSGKSRHLCALLDQDLQAPDPRTADTIIVVDPKGETADLLLRRIAEIASRLNRAARRTLLARLTVIRPFLGDYLVPWQILAREPSVAPSVQAAAVGQTLEAILAVGTGIRQSTMLTALLTIAILAGWSVLDLRFAIYDQNRLRRTVETLAVPDLRVYVHHRFGNEAKVTVDGLGARLDALLAIPDLKAMLAGPESLSLTDLFAPGRITIIDLGGAPMGSEQVQQALGALILTRLSWAVFDPTRPLTSDVVLVCDELQQLLTPHVVSAIDRMLVRSRSYKTAFVGLHQGVDQLPRELQTTLGTNARMRVLGRSSRRNAELSAEYLGLTGRVPKRREPWMPPPTQPEFLSEAEETKLRVNTLAQFPPRRFLINEPGTNLPPQEVTAPFFDPPSWDEIPKEIADAVLRGRLGQPRQVLIERARVIEEEAARSLEGNAEGSPPSRGRRTAPASDLPDAMDLPNRRSGRRREVP